MNLNSPSFLYSLSKDYFEKSYVICKDIFKEGYSQNIDLFWKISFPAVTMSFSLELAFKGILLFENKNISKKTFGIHDLLSLFSKISPEIQNKIINYQETREIKFQLPNIILSKRENGNRQAPERFYSNTLERTHSILKSHKDSFVNFRYLHEFGSKNEIIDYDFAFNYFSNITIASITILAELLGITFEFNAQ